jgi:hypothetical protein
MIACRTASTTGLLVKHQQSATLIKSLSVSSWPEDVNNDVYSHAHKLLAYLSQT